MKRASLHVSAPLSIDVPLSACSHRQEDSRQTWRLQVTVMEEFEEEWPVAKEGEVEVATSEVSLEPVTSEVPEIAMEEVEVEVCRSVLCRGLLVLLGRVLVSLQRCPKLR